MDAPTRLAHSDLGVVVLLLILFAGVLFWAFRGRRRDGDDPGQ